LKFLNPKVLLLFLSFAGGYLFSLETAWSEVSREEDPSALAGDLLRQSFRIREQVTIVLDGSEASSGIARKTQFINELVYLSPQKWRARRQLPFLQESYEFLMNGKAVHLMNPFNHGVEPPFSVPAKTYLEIVLSPLRFSQNWKMGGISTLEELLKAVRKAPLQTDGGDRIELEEADGNLTLKLSGKIFHDGKTQMAIESVWQILDRGKIQEVQLAQSLLRSL
jgi:hypothetical protein